jgi:hypothetical protein
LTRDYYAIDELTSDVYYFGEDVDVYRNWRVVSRKGSWLSGVNGAKFGLMMPGSPKAGQRFYQEQAPGVGMDRAEIVSATETANTPAGTFENWRHARFELAHFIAFMCWRRVRSRRAPATTSGMPKGSAP